MPGILNGDYEPISIPQVSSDSEFIREFGEYSLWESDGCYTDDYLVTLTHDPENRVLAFLRVSLPRRKRMRVTGVWVAREHRGLGIAQYLYEFLILEREITLVSGHKQTEAGYAQWKLLNKNPLIHVHTKRSMKQWNNKFLFGDLVAEKNGSLVDR